MISVRVCALQGVVEQRVALRREAELVQLRVIARLRAVQQFFAFGMPVLASVPVFIIVTRTGDSLPPSTIFTAVALLEFLNMGLTVIPLMINEIRRMAVSVKRIEKFLAIPETYVAPQALKGEVGRVVIGGTGSFEFGSVLTAPDGSSSAGPLSSENASKPPETTPVAPPAAADGPPLALDGVHFETVDGGLTVVCGRVGSGKTSLVSAALGLLREVEGTELSVQGRVAYVPQSAFIMNATVRENILFGAPLDEALYAKVVSACELESDIASLPSGHETEIGERGITISGGQRQRISIARAAYAGAELVILDDPLSAMDPHVGQRVFSQCICGLLSGVTRIFCTNALQFATTAERIYYLDKGCVVESGTHAELVARDDGQYAALYAHVASTVSFEEAAPAADVPETWLYSRLPPPPATNVAAPVQPISDAASSEPPAGTTAAAPAPAAVVLAAAPPTPTAVATTQAAAPNAAPSAPGKESLPSMQAVQIGAKGSDGKLVQVERRAKGRIGLSTFMPMARAAKSHRLGFALVFVLFLAPCLQYGVNGLLGRWTEAVFDKNEAIRANTTDEVSRWAEADELGRLDGTGSSDDEEMAMYVVGAAIFACVAALRGIGCAIFFLRSSKTLHAEMLHAVLMSPMRFFDTTPVGRILNRFSGDVMQLDLALPRLFDIWSYIVGANLLMFVMSAAIAPPMIAINAFLLTLMYWLYSYYVNVAIELQRLMLITVSPIAASLSSFLIGLETIRAFGRVETFRAQFTAKQVLFVRTMTALQAIERVTLTTLVTVGVSCFFLLLSTTLLLLARARFLVTPSSAGVVLSLAGILSFRLPAMFLTTGNLERLLAAGQRAIEYTKLPPEDPPVLSEAGSKGAIAAAKGTGTRTSQYLSASPPYDASIDFPKDGTLELRDVTLRYAPHLPPVLVNVSFSVASGERVGM